ncbi:hypothetical protein [Actibacterium lipolyticum]|uniref:Uncharacterized protein n=1 Tax=Actibacterium lipolyticum TaxID=1524263 RepID=A0A238JLH7_9RHOB|nr:hypothetical protein [Actibacterium lipolyticum]SMX31530.1 hypothetical protein COL8621_00496 [Actibacterium lipolyticum]
MKLLTFAAALTALSFTPAFAGHANPWTTAIDTLLEKYHDTNQEKSADTPGENEMRGKMVQRAKGKLDNTVGPASKGKRDN